MHGAAVTLTGVEKFFDHTAAVRGVSLDIRPGEFLTLLGSSGSGKTTTLMMIAGFEKPSAGTIAIDGVMVQDLPPHRRGIGMVFQTYALFPHMTAGENIAFPLRQRGVDKATQRRLVRETLDLVRLPGHEDRYPRQLSGGQQQRIALARAIVFRPSLLLMDEPLGALDKQLRESMQREIRRLHQELGITFLYVTHDQEEALTMSDRIAVMNDGRIAQLGTPEDLYDRPADRFVASFIGESNFLTGVARGEDHGMAVIDHNNVMLRAPSSHPPRTGQKITVTIRPERMYFKAPLPDSNTLRVRIIESSFTGECRRYVCDADGSQIVVKEQASLKRNPGDIVDLTWSPADTIVI